MKNNKLDYYIFVEELNEKTIKNIIKLKKQKLKINIIILEKNFLTAVKFAKKERIPFFVVDNIKSAIKNGAQGVFLTNKYKTSKNNIKKTTKLDVIGSAHNQHEYYIKKKQNCNTIMLSPIFFNKKYSINKILGIIKFNLITLNWNCNICALGGITLNNLKMINLTKAKAISFMSMINDKNKQ
jgi:thiamine monophosphate synthase